MGVHSEVHARAVKKFTLEMKQQVDIEVWVGWLRRLV
jgi:hypothetical protein